MGSKLRSISIFFKTVFRGCSFIFGSILFVFAIGVIISLVIFLVRYESWMSQNQSIINQAAIEEIPNRKAVKAEMNKRLKAFQQSRVQRESMNLTCDMLAVLIEDTLKEGWDIDNEDAGIVCDNRSFTVYIKFWELWWITVNVWQRAEGSVDFVVYDVKVGPFSLAGITFGYLSQGITDGVKDATSLVSGDTYSGRKMEKLYLDEGGMRIVGVLKEEDEESDTEEGSVSQ